MAANARFQKMQREIMERYGNDRVKANEEIQKLMQKENISMTAGCLPMIAPMFVMLGVYYSVINPLTNTLHIASDKVNSALQSLSALPGIGSEINSQYGQISIVKYFDNIQKYLTNSDGSALFNSGEIHSINEFANGFNFLGWDLLASPNASSFQSLMWLIPVLCFVTSVGAMFITQKLNGTQMKGCMNAMIFIMPLFSVLLLSYLRLQLFHESSFFLLIFFFPYNCCRNDCPTFLILAVFWNLIYFSYHRLYFYSFGMVPHNREHLYRLLPLPVVF